jgi:amylosucrase
MTGPNDEGRVTDIAFEAQLSLQRILPRLDSVWQAESDAQLQREFLHRMQRHWPDLFAILLQLYGTRYDFFYHLEQILLTAAHAMRDRPATLQELDRQRINDATWFQAQELTGGALYVDLFSDNLGRLREHIGYFRDLGLTCLHLMPLFAVAPETMTVVMPSVTTELSIPDSATIEDLRLLAADLREVGISLILDFVFNHTSEDHDWAQQAQAGVREYQQFYHIFPDRHWPNEYEKLSAKSFRRCVAETLPGTTECMPGSGRRSTVFNGI